MRNLFIPDAHASNWIDILNEIINRHKIDYIFPAYDDVIVALTQNIDKFNTNIISSPLFTCLICRSTTKNYSKFKNLLPIPEIFNTLFKIDTFPVFVKPDKGQGPQNAHIVNDLKTLKLIIKK